MILTQADGVQRPACEPSRCCARASGIRQRPIARTQIGTHLQVAPRKEQAAEIVDGIDVTEVGLDFIVFCMPKGLCRGIQVDFIARNKVTMSPADVAAMF